MDRTNHQTISKVFNDALQILWPNGIQHEKVYVVATDAARYMVKAFDSLRVLYTRMTHVTCLAHGLHRVCEAIREKYSVTNAFISACKKIFKKAPSRVETFRNLCPGLALPPSPVCTRWGTWLAAAAYYAENHNKIEAVLNALEDDAESIKKAKMLVQDPKLTEELTKLRSHYTFLACEIIKLEKSGAPLIDSLSILQDVTQKLIKCPDEDIKQKMISVLDKNEGLKALSAVAEVHMDKIAKYPQFTGLTPLQLSCFKRAPVVSCDVERSFSLYNRIYTDVRKKFSFENLRKHVIIACNPF